MLRHDLEEPQLMGRDRCIARVAQHVDVDKGARAGPIHTLDRGAQVAKDGLGILVVDRHEERRSASNGRSPSPSRAIGVT
ncbi:MAG: hypothetical protein R3D25_17805 [Geminicoccaceae bacterium]